MNNKELVILGKNLQYLLENNKIEKVKEIFSVMASGKKPEINNQGDITW